MGEINPQISKLDFIEYLRYLKIVLKENLNDNKIIKSIDECIELENKYNPSAYYYGDLLEDFNNLVESKITKNVIRWVKITTWKAYLRKKKIEKMMKNNGL